MSKFPVPKDLRYSERHEWARHTADGNYKTGLTPFALDLLGELVYLELPQVGEAFNANDPIGIVEAVQAATDIFTPISGKIIAVNEDLISDPKIIEQDPYENGWLLEFAADSNTDKTFSDLMDAEKYDACINQ